MAEIKSALEIALERAAALGAGEDDSKRQAQEKGQALARQCLEGDLTGTDLAAELSGLGAEATAAAVGHLLEALDEGRAGALPALAALCLQGPARQAYEALELAQAQRAEALAALEAELAGEMSQSLAALGIGGSAVRPNPAAHPEYQARCDAALGVAQAQLKAAGQDLLQALA
jgi:hypothetical protein